MNGTPTTADERLLHQFEGLSRWLDAEPTRPDAPERLRLALGDRLFDALIGGLAPRRPRLAG